MLFNPKETYYHHLEAHAENFSRIDLAHKNFMYCNFNNCRFEEGTIDHCTFYHCSFKDCFLSCSSSGCIFQACSFENIIWQRAQQKLKLLKCQFSNFDASLLQLDYCHFYALDLGHMPLPWEQIQNSTFDQCKFDQIDAVDKILDNITFSRSHFTKSSFAKAQFRATSFNECALHECDFSQLNADHLQCVNSVLNQVSFNQAKASQGSIFMGTELTQVDFTGAFLHASTFENAKLQDISFKESKALSFNISHAQLTNVNFKKAKLDHPMNNFSQFKNITWDNKAQETLFSTPSAEEKAFSAFVKTD